jgi:hypothetical protein
MHVERARSDDATAVRALVEWWHAGTGLGRRLLAWAGDGARARGRRSLRLDCVGSNTFLRRYYAEAGFEKRGEVGAGRFLLARFELTLPSL